MRIVIDNDVAVPLADGTVLRADVYRPETRDPLPVLLQRTPYDKGDIGTLGYGLDGLRAVRAGYALVVQDVRGRYASQGTFAPFVDEASDGADTVAWAAAQPWSDGRVGMVGGSYVGATQWLAASAAPDALEAIAPFVTAADYHEGWAYQGGAFALGFNLRWAYASLALAEVDRRAARGAVTPDELLAFAVEAHGSDTLYDRLPLVDVPELADVAPYYLNWLAGPDRDDRWRALAPREHHHTITAPACNIGGWYDLFLGGTLDNYRGMRATGGSLRARSLQRLVVGPWSHNVHGGAFVGRDYGALSGTDGLDLTALQLRWFDHVLRDVDNGVDREPPVRLFVMGVDTWRDEHDWPLPDTRWTDQYLHSDGHAATTGGGLSVEPPGDEPCDVFRSDPHDPVPTVGGPTYLPGAAVGANAGPRDRRAIERRSDVLTYTTAPLQEPLEVTGPVTLTVQMSTSVVDTDITGALVDVHPDGRAELLTEGILRARYRHSLSAPEPLEPDRIHELHVDLWATSNVFGAGHRIRLEVSSSNFPRFDRNPNTGGVIATTGSDDLVTAVTTIHHDRRHPSHVTLPIIGRR
jgi:putative CocE/NonD family hydrolase